ncbi:MAG: ABC transporter ATP-binding protein [Nitrospirota bacterium]|nr:MAG: ABC transporter ATP-binding protein [Nitrospirota bacterium]
MLSVENLSVSVEGRQILHDLNLHVMTGETVALFGPNGSGKTSLLKAIIGVPSYSIESGKIIFKGNDLTRLSMHERAVLGIGMSFQRPPAIRGVKLRDLLVTCVKKRGGVDPGDINDMIMRLGLSDLAERDINKGFSGGEIKRSELIQLQAQGPDLLLLDEPDSGVDLISIELVGSVINELLQKDRKKDRREKAGLIISHAGHILDYVNADRAYVMLNGTLQCSGNPRELLDDIIEKGYEGCTVCKG